MLRGNAKLPQGYLWQANQPNAFKRPAGSVKKTHIILVSDQAAPAFLPVLDPELMPDRVILLVTPAMEYKGKAASLEQLLRRKGIRVDKHRMPAEQDYGAIEESLLDMALKPDYALDTGIVYLNLTGGTKLMALAAQNLARSQFEEHWRPFYVDLATNRILWLGNRGWPNGSHQQPRELGTGIRLPDYLLGYGYEVRGRAQTPSLSKQRRDVIMEIVTKVGAAPIQSAALGRLNFLADKAEQSRQLQVEFDRDPGTDSAFKALLDGFAHAECLDYSSTAIQFKSEAERDFVKGGWLEHHTFAIVSALHRELGIQDHAQGLQVREVATGAGNELDVCFMHRNRLFVMECKTARMDLSERANDTLYKLVNVHARVGGVGARGMLVTFRNLQSSELNLAKVLGVRVVQGNGIAHLSAAIREWVGEG